MSKTLTRFVLSPRPPENTNVLWIKDTNDEFALYAFGDNGWEETGMARNKLLEIVAQLQEEIKANNNILGSVTYDGLAPTPLGSGKYTFSTGSDSIKCTWITKDDEGNNVSGVGTFVSSSDEVIVVKNLITNEYEYYHIAISKVLTDELGTKASHGYEEGETAKTLKEVEDFVVQVRSELLAATVYISANDYQMLIDNELVNPDVEYNIYEE